MEGLGRPIRVAVVGGGCAALTAAFELTRPAHQGRYEVTVYQMGWRLGGKGASGRGASGRIEEHGLHLWMGFYENAFRLMRECYEELGRDPATCPIATWRDAFEPAPEVAVTERAPNGDWAPWIARFAPGRGLPGDPLHESNPFTVRAYLLQAAGLVVELIRSALTSEPAAPFSPGTRPTPDAPMLSALIDAALRYGQFATTAVLYEATDLLRVALASVFPHAHRGPDDNVLRLLDAIADEARRRCHALAGRDPEVGNLWHVVDVILAVLRGSLRAGLAFDPRGFDALDDFEWRAWLRENGATEPSLDSGFVRGIYDLAFAFEHGDAARPALAASVALRGAMRMFFTYRGALFWRMTAGMGDIVFAPLYEVLRRRGVRFEFFHRLRNVGLAPEARGALPSVRTLTFDVQARVRDGAAYDPLIDVRNLPCWPSEPRWEQLEQADALRAGDVALESPFEARVAGERVLSVSKDFDLTVLGLSVGAIPLACPELLARLPTWRAMTERIKTVATQAFQVWMRDDMRALGWRHPPVNLSGFVEPFDTWADMGHLLPREDWRTPVRSLAYFCSPLPDEEASEPVDEPRARRRVRESAVRFLDRDIGALWPRAVGADGGFRWELLVSEDGTERHGSARFDTQFYTANVRPSERYVLSVPGSSRFRISPLDLTVDNLTVAGDWTASGLNSGCIESAVMSGMLAAHALSAAPRLEDIVGYDHP